MIKAKKTTCFYRLQNENGEILENSNNYSSVQFLCFAGIPMLLCTLAMLRTDRGHRIIEVFHKKTGKRLGSFEDVGNNILENVIKHIGFSSENMGEREMLSLQKLLKNRSIEAKIKESIKTFKKKEEKPFGVEFEVLDVNFGSFEAFSEVKEIMTQKWGQEMDGVIAFCVVEDFLNLLYAFENDINKKNQIKNIQKNLVV